MIYKWLYKKIPIQILLWIIRNKFGKRDLYTFERFLESDKWEKVNHYPEKWIFTEDNSFVIEESLERENFYEKWTQVFPDKTARVKEVYLKINNELITKPLRFVSVDGGKYFVPLPKIDIAYGEIYFYWDKDSIDYKVFKIIGFLNGYKDLEEFGKRCHVLVK